MGGVTGNELAREFKSVLQQTTIPGNPRFYDLRGSITTELRRTGVSDLMVRYITGHSTNDILLEYVALDPGEEMQSYFNNVRPLTAAMMDRANELRLNLQSI